MKYINKTFKYIVLLVFILTLGTSCEKDFTEMNIDPTQPTETSINFLFTGLQSQTDFPGDFQLYALNERYYQWSQLGAYQGGGDPVLGADYPNNMNERGYKARWGQFYQFLANYEVIKQKEAADADPDRLVIRIKIAEILRAYMGLCMTDTYGDIPYSEAGKGSSELIYRPVFDSQEMIYKDALQVLDDAATVLSGVSDGDFTAAGSLIESYGVADIMYQGDVDKWIKFANTIRLRYALRMSNVDAAFAAPHISDAYAGALMESYDDGYKFEGISKHFAYEYGPQLRLGETAWKYMNADDDPAVDGSDIIDPRVHIWYETNNAGEWVAAPISWDYDARPDGITGDPYNPDRRNDNDDEGDNWKGSYSAQNWYVADNLSSNIEWQVTYSESCFLRAEVAFKAGSDNDAKNWYEKGIEASILKFYKLNTHEDWTNAPEVPTAEEIDAFINHPRIAYNSSTGLEQIITQRWLDCHYNPGEAWYIVRRTGLIPLGVVKDRAESAIVPMATRVIYPPDELDQNMDNFNDQLEKMGENSYTAPIWWDN